MLRCNGVRLNTLSAYYRSYDVMLVRLNALSAYYRCYDVMLVRLNA